MNSKTVGDITVVAVVPKFDAFAPRRGEPVLLELIESGARKMVLDFSETLFVSSAGIRVVTAVAKKLQAVEGKLAICGLQPKVRKVFTMAGIPRLIPFFETEAEARNSLTSAAAPPEPEA